MKKFSCITFIEALLQYSPRQLENETKAANFILAFLQERGVKARQHRFAVTIPRAGKAVLRADRKAIPCQNCGYIGGKIVGKDRILSSLIPSRFFIEQNNINFNPECPKAISCSNFYFAPSVAVSRSSIPTILEAKRVEGETKVTPVKHRAINILVGNTENPRSICFAHYDSINKGAIDNASGVAVMTDVILRAPETLENTLYVYSANEELSYDKPTYWGHGFRAFEKSYFSIMQNAKTLIAVDSLGNGPTQVTQSPNLLHLGFPIANLKKWEKKTYIVAGNIQRLMTVYHSDADDATGIEMRYLKEGAEALLRIVR